MALDLENMLVSSDQQKIGFLKRRELGSWRKDIIRMIVLFKIKSHFFITFNNSISQKWLEDGERVNIAIVCPSLMMKKSTQPIRHFSSLCMGTVSSGNNRSQFATHASQHICHSTSLKMPVDKNGPINWCWFGALWTRRQDGRGINS